MSDDPWHVCRDGLTPITEAVGKVMEPDVADLVKWLRSGAGTFTGPSGDLSRVTSKTWIHAGTHTATSTRQQMVRWWLQSNGHEADAREFDSKLTELIKKLRDCEHVVRQEANSRKSNWKAKEETGKFLEVVDIIGQTGCDALNEFTDEAWRTWNFLKHLDSTIRAKLAQQPAVDVEKYQERFDAIGRKLDDLQLRLNVIDEVPELGTADDAADGDEDDPTLYLTGQSLRLFELLREESPNWLPFSILSSEQDLWRVADPTDSAIDKAFDRLSCTLQESESRYCVLWSKRDRRGRVMRIQPGSRPTI